MTGIDTQELLARTHELDYRGLIDEHGRTEGMRIYRERTNELEAQWREYLRETNAPSHWTAEQFDVIYRQAWADGHASGYTEVESHIYDLVQLVEDFERAGR